MKTESKNIIVVGYDEIMEKLRERSEYTEVETLICEGIRLAKENPTWTDEQICSHMVGFKWGELDGVSGYVGEGEEGESSTAHRY